MSAAAAKGAGKAEKAEGKKSPLLLILLVVIIVLLLGGGGAAFYFFKSASHAASAPAKAVPPVFFPLDAFTVNLAADDGGDTHYLHLGLTLKVEDEEATKNLTTYLPEIRSRILLLLSSKHAEDLSTVAGKNKLSDEIMKTVEQPFVKDGSHAKVNGVLFTDFVIQ
ncbi:MAG: flagellar basal body-associated protein FliL [Janthinobacterium lividum]